MAQSWQDLLFAHWPVPVEELRRAVPASLPLDTFEGQAWVGVVPFRMSGVRPRVLPSMPRLSAFPELNVRTYVTADGRPGVFFFSLDAASPLAVACARRWYALPYFNAHMSASREGDAIRYASHRTHAGAPPAEFAAWYRPTGPAAPAEPETLAWFLTARYCLYTIDRRGRLLRAEIDHAPWPLQPAEAEIRVNTMTVPHGIHLPDTPPLLHFSRRVDVTAWWPERVRSAKREAGSAAPRPSGPESPAPSPFSLDLAAHEASLPQAFRDHYLTGADAGQEIVIEGSMDQVWHRPGWLWPILWLLARANLLFPEQGRDIPVTLRITPGRDRDGHPYHHWHRVFRFAVHRCFRSTIAYDPRLRRTIEWVGPGRVLGMHLKAGIRDSHTIELVSHGCVVRLGRARWWLPRLLSVDVRTLERADTTREGLIHIELTTTHPLLGPVFGYRGSFHVSRSGGELTG